ncbi:hypothetical protein ACVWZ6_009112 [Bradyrhizobium sp. GM6.1]
MTMLKILSAALIATTMLTTAASAYENPMHKRHAVEHAHPGSISPFADEFDRHPWMSGPPVGAYSTTPSEQPGGICDHGDNPQIC